MRICCGHGRVSAAGRVSGFPRDSANLWRGWGRLWNDGHITPIAWSDNVDTECTQSASLTSIASPSIAILVASLQHASILKPPSNAHPIAQSLPPSLKPSASPPRSLLDIARLLTSTRTHPQPKRTSSIPSHNRRGVLDSSSTGKPSRPTSSSIHILGTALTVPFVMAIDVCQPTRFLWRSAPRGPTVHASFTLVVGRGRAGRCGEFWPSFDVCEV